MLLSADNTQPRHDMHNRWPRAERVEDLRNNPQGVRQSIHEACLQNDRLASDVRLLSVSKTWMKRISGWPVRPGVIFSARIKCRRPGLNRR